MIAYDLKIEFRGKILNKLLFNENRNLEYWKVKGYVKAKIQIIPALSKLIYNKNYLLVENLDL